MDCCEAGFYEVLNKIEQDGLTPVNKQFLSVLLPQKSLMRVYEVMRNDAIQLTTARGSKRSMWTVTTKKGTYYIFIEPENKYCSCLSFGSDVLKSGKLPFCKHVMACLLCQCLYKRGTTDGFSVVEMEDREFSRYFANVVTASNMGGNVSRR